MLFEQKLEHVLLEKGFLSPFQLREIKEIQQKTGSDFDSVILSEAFLSLHELNQAKQMAVSEQNRVVSSNQRAASDLPMLSEQDVRRLGVVSGMETDYRTNLPMLDEPPVVTGVPIGSVAVKNKQNALEPLPQPQNVSSPQMKQALGVLEQMKHEESFAETLPPQSLSALVPAPEQVGHSQSEQALEALEQMKYEESFAETLAPQSLSDLVPNGNTHPKVTSLPQGTSLTAESNSQSEWQSHDGLHCYNCGEEQEKKSMLCAKCHAFLLSPDGGDHLVGRLLGSRFLLNGRLGAGGMGLVYHATDLANDSFVACKILPIQLSTDEQTIKRFELEARVMLELDHPHIVRAIDFGFEEGIGCYLSMELLIGEEFWDYLKAKKILSPKEVITVFSQVCDAMGYAHEKGVVHRDLKPSNLFLMGERETLSSAKVIDFGIARLTTDDMPRHTVTGTFVGTPQYMSPEQASAKKDLDHRSDIYSLGIILFECLTGRVPFVGSHLAQLLMSQVYMQPPKLAEIRPEIEFPEAMQAFLDSVLEKDPKKRLSSMQAFRDGLHKAVQGVSPEMWGASSFSNASDKKRITENLVSTANRLLSENQLTPFKESMEPQALFEQLALALRSASVDTSSVDTSSVDTSSVDTSSVDTSSVGEVAILLLSEEVKEEEEAVDLEVDLRVDSYPLSQVVSPTKKRTRSSDELPMAAPQRTIDSFRTKQQTYGIQRQQKVSMVEDELEKAQGRKLLFMFIFAFLFFALLVGILWFSRS